MSSCVIDITLEDLESLTKMLLDEMRSAHFEPDVIIYLETGARLLAFYFHKATGIPAISLSIQRPGNSIKVRIASLLCLLPRSLHNVIRQVERKFSLQRSNARKMVTSALETNLIGKKILILDDAADSGQSLILARQWALESGGSEMEIRLATIAVTQPRTEKIVDYWIYSQLCRFPWSSDSQERREYLKLYEQIDPTKLAAGTL